jgi:hypothetical protein
MVARSQLLGVRGTRGLSPGERGPRPPATGHDALGDTLDARMRTALETAQVRRNPTESGMPMAGHRTSKRLSPKMVKSLNPSRNDVMLSSKAADVIKSLHLQSAAAIDLLQTRLS